MLGSRAIWHEGWKAVSTHPTIAGWSDFNDDTWELYNVDTDRAELHNLADQHPDKLRELINLWFLEAGNNGAFPLDDRSPIEILNTPRPQLTSPRNRYRYYAGVAEVPEAQAVNIRNRDYIVGAWSTSRRPEPRACCSRTARSSAGTRCTSRTTGSITSTTSSAWSSRRSWRPRTCRSATTCSCRRSSSRTARTPRASSAPGILSLYHGEEKVGEGRIKTQPAAFGLTGSGLTVGRSLHRISSDYPGERTWDFTGGRIHFAAVDVSGEPYVDLEREAAAMMARE